MISRITKRMQVGGEGGFTLIELLVVIIIIGILAAIAIPMYLSQRTKGYNATAESDLRNAAVAQESWFTDHGEYTSLLAELESTAGGYRHSATITLVPTASTATEYCMSAKDSRGGDMWYMSSGSSAPTKTGCVPL